MVLLLKTFTKHLTVLFTTNKAMVGLIISANLIEQRIRPSQNICLRLQIQ